MDVFEAIKNRKSVRAYSPKPVPNKLLRKIAEAAQLAPSAGNIQPWHFIFVTDKDKRKNSKKVNMQGFLLNLLLSTSAAVTRKPLQDGIWLMLR
jgi:nitroreductase